MNVKMSSKNVVKLAENVLDDADYKKIEKQEASAESQSNSLSDIVSESYSCSQTLDKAVKKVKNALPFSSKRKKAVLLHMFDKMDDAEKNELMNVMKPPLKKKQQAIKDIEKDIQMFLERDDISRVSPKSRDVKTYTCPDTGDDIVKPTRHMVLSMKEAFALFVDERKTAEKGTL